MKLQLQPTIGRVFRVLLLVSLAGVTGCPQAVFEETDVVVKTGPQTCWGALGSDGDRRFFRYDLDLRYGTKPPQKILDRASAPTKAWVQRSVDTQEVSGPSVGWAKGWLVVSIGLLVASLILLGRTLAKKVYDDRSAPTVTTTRLVVAIALVVAAISGATFAGLRAGSHVIIENASGHSVDVLINGKLYTRLKPKRFVRTRVGGRQIHIDVRKDGKLVERITATPDRDVSAMIRRALLGNGTYLYNICGINRYQMEKAVYGPD